MQAAEPYSSLTDDERALGIVKPIWIPDEEALQCMDCNQRFTVLRRRHHCRACGRLLCGNCCSSRARLEYMENKESRVCLPCLQVLKKVEAYQKWGRTAEEEQQAAASGGAGTSITLYNLILIREKPGDSGFRILKNTLIYERRSIYISIKIHSHWLIYIWLM